MVLLYMKPMTLSNRRKYELEVIRNMSHLFPVQTMMEVMRVFTTRLFLKMLIINISITWDGMTGKSLCDGIFQISQTAFLIQSRD